VRKEGAGEGVHNELLFGGKPSRKKGKKGEVENVLGGFAANGKKKQPNTVRRINQKKKCD